ncbi:9139_t:CDS:2 [Ambispora leptoticha]|uniref:9139_t:CDS:1 n=1 Tax=Ambispora leptoticha TaxID=144679 RepID=A0A9N9FQI3_9GLOM|nr:9139_t:CDS:2 [Ambispora leptoticha]
MDLQNFNMDDRVQYAIPKRGKNDIEKLQTIFQDFIKKLKLCGQTKSNENISAVIPPLKKVDQLKTLNDDELKQELREKGNDGERNLRSFEEKSSIIRRKYTHI